ncbi:YjjG family noncanonical pyrimidine nucleotidase [Riemerella columbipharyngis]|uniref:Putative hydrolase of the HAD superfamily n=1 Tax=Riemerella columbipharyngis TaxID=1071918 RepID=A0A1G7ELS8_9FLAO|nr:YjjG family noncanonical pyrimidine nucleotidase [Riemerella columbipharyngis]SDE64604.1 putative hydrolase of the HAD superfamily [Riemerella columbipharyngis]
MLKEKINHIFFDLDNTLWDHRKNARLALKKLFDNHSLADKLNVDFQGFYKCYYNSNESLWDKLRDGKIDKTYLRKHRFYDVFIDFGFNDFELSQTFEEQFLETIIEFNELIPDAREILQYLSEKDYVIHIVSNGFQEVTYRKIEGGALGAYFTTVTSADEVGVRKPNPEIFQYAVDIADAKVEESIFIGDDWIADALGARDFGMKSVFLDLFNQNPYAEGVLTIKELKEIKQIL